MSEIKPIYATNNDGKAFPQTFTVYMLQVGELSDLEQVEGRKQSAIVRDAVDLYFQTKKSAKVQEMLKLTSLPLIELVLRAIDQVYERIEAIIGEQSE